MGISERINAMGTSAALLGAWTLIASVGAIVLNASDLLDGEGYAIIRVFIGLLGLAAAFIFWSGRNFGMDGLLAIIIWGIIQIPAFAQIPDGNVTKQLMDFPLGMESSSTVNGVITQYSQIGLNLVGIAIVIWGRSCQSRLDLWRRRAQPAVTV